MTHKSLGLMIAATLSMYAGASNANSITFEQASSTYFLTASNASDSTQGNDIKDYFSFVIPASTIGDIDATLTVTTFKKTESANINKISLLDSNNNVLSFVTNDTALSYTGLGAGTYQLYVQGAYTGKYASQGSYTGTISLVTTPVPEPESYSMILAGLGLMGFVAARRKA